MPVRVDKEMRHRVGMKREHDIYQSPDHGKTIYHREIYDDVSGVKIGDADENVISRLSKKVLELEYEIDKIKAIIK